MMRTPSYFSSKTQLGRLNGSSTKVVSIGETRNGTPGIAHPISAEANPACLEGPGPSCFELCAIRVAKEPRIPNRVYAAHQRAEEMCGPRAFGTANPRRLYTKLRMLNKSRIRDATTLP